MKKRFVIGGLTCMGLIGGISCSPVRQDIALTSAIAYSSLTQPNDATTRTIRKAGSKWGTLVNLTPKPFNVGAAEKDVVAELAESKYIIDPDRKISWHDPQAFPVDSQFYEKSVGGLPCALHYGIVVRFDDQHRLLEAWGAQDEAGCL